MSTSVASNSPHPAPLHSGLSFVGVQRQRGQALVFSLLASMLIILSLYAMYSMNSQAVEKVRLQNTADSAAYSAAVAEARDYNFSAYTNRAMVANQVAVAQFVGLTSWFRNMSAFANNNVGNAGRTVYQLFFDIFQSPLGKIYMRFLKGFGKVTGVFDENPSTGALGPGAKLMGAMVTVMDGLIKVYSETQRIYHYSTALTVSETLGVFSTVGDALSDLTGASWFSGLDVLEGSGNIVKLNDPNARLSTIGGMGHFIHHMYQWFNFTERKDPNTANKDGEDADRFAQVTLDSLDDFSRDRSTKPAWGFTFFYAPPLTFIDPTRFIPYQNGPLFMPVIHRGGTELKVTNTSGDSGTSTTAPAGDTGVDCHGNPISATTGGGNSPGISVPQWSDLSSHSSTACEGETGMVTVGDGTHPKGVYAYNGSSWIDPSKMTNTQGSSSGRNASSGSGNPGPAGSRSKKTWTAMDASSWAGIDIIWFTIPIIFVPIPLPIPFAPPWMPLSHGGALSGQALPSDKALAGDNNFGVDSDDAYGGVASSWTTRVPARMRQSRGPGKPIGLISGLGGLVPYMDVADLGADNLEGPALVVELEKPTSKMPKSPGSGPLALENAAPGDKLRVLSKAQVIFARPTTDSALDWFKRVNGSATQAELGSLYNPYWQPRLTTNTFLEQYLSMEMQRAGM